MNFPSLRRPFGVVALVLASTLPTLAADALPAGDPPPCIVKNVAFFDTWTIRVADKLLPVGVIKFYDMNNKALATIKSSGDTFTLGPRGQVKMAVCPSPRSADLLIGITLAFAKKGFESAPCSIINIKELISATEPRFSYGATCAAVSFDPQSYRKPLRDTPFVTVGK